jgi:hypothetical protein
MTNLKPNARCSWDLFKKFTEWLCGGPSVMQMGCLIVVTISYTQQCVSNNSGDLCSVIIICTDCVVLVLLCCEICLVLDKCGSEYQDNPWTTKTFSKRKKFNMMMMMMRGKANLQFQGTILTLPKWDIICVNRQMIVRKIAEDTWKPNDSCYVVLTDDVGAQRASEKFSPRVLTEDQKLWCIYVCREFLHEQMTITFFLTLSPEMILKVIMGMMLKQSYSCHYWTILICNAHKCIKMRKQCCFFLIIVALFLMSSFQQTRQLIKLIIREFWAVWGMQYQENQKCDTSITTMHLLEEHSQFKESWQIIQFLYFHNLPVCLTHPFGYFLFPTTKFPLKGRLQTIHDEWFNKHPLNRASKSGKHDDSRALLLIKIILKGDKSWNNSYYWRKFWKLSEQTSYPSLKLYSSISLEKLQKKHKKNVTRIASHQTGI